MFYFIVNRPYVISKEEGIILTVSEFLKNLLTDINKLTCFGSLNFQTTAYYFQKSLTKLGIRAHINALIF